jgi:hypothetical protein
MNTIDSPRLAVIDKNIANNTPKRIISTDTERMRAYLLFYHRSAREPDLTFDLRELEGSTHLPKCNPILQLTKQFWKALLTKATSFGYAHSC